MQGKKTHLDLLSQQLIPGVINITLTILLELRAQNLIFLAERKGIFVSFGVVARHEPYLFLVLDENDSVNELSKSAVLTYQIFSTTSSPAVANQVSQQKINESDRLLEDEKHSLINAFYVEKLTIAGDDFLETIELFLFLFYLVFITILQCNDFPVHLFFVRSY